MCPQFLFDLKKELAFWMRIFLYPAAELTFATLRSTPYHAAGTPAQL